LLSTNAAGGHRPKLHLLRFVVDLFGNVLCNKSAQQIDVVEFGR